MAECETEEVEPKKKTRKRIDHPDPIRRLVFHKSCVKGESGRKVAQDLDLPKSTVYDMIRAFKEDGGGNYTGRRRGGGRKRKVTDEQLDLLARCLVVNPHMSIKELANEFTRWYRKNAILHSASSLIVRKALKSSSC
jgi:transposase